MQNFTNKIFISITFIATCMASTAMASEHHHGASHAVSETVGVTVGGFLTTTAAMVSEDLNTSHANPVFFNDAEVHIKYNNKTDRGMKYGAVIEMEADVSTASRNEGLNADKTYVFLESGFGRVELGANTDAGARLKVDASNFARATGGIHGDWYQIAEFPAAGHGGSHSHDNFIHMPALPLHHKHGAAEDANKLTYFTPEISGFQAGISYIPDTGDVGTAAGFSGKAGHTDYNDVLSGGVSYKQKFGAVALNAALTGEFGRAELPGHANLRAYTAGANLGYDGFSFGASYGDWGNSLNHIPAAANGSYYTIGTGYENGNAGVSIGYMSSEYQKNKLNTLSIGADYLVAAGLSPFVEVIFASMDAESTTHDNEAVVTLLGSRLSF